MAWRDPRGGSQPPASREGAGADRNCAAEPGGSGAFRAAEGGAANEGCQQDGPGPVDRRDRAGPRGHPGDERPCLARRHHTRTQRRELGLGRRAFLLARLRMRVGLTPRLPGTPRSRGCRRFRVSCAVIRTPDCQGEARSRRHHHRAQSWPRASASACSCRRFLGRCRFAVARPLAGRRARWPRAPRHRETAGTRPSSRPGSQFPSNARSPWPRTCGGRAGAGHAPWPNR